jgi:hypothetical protein
MHQSLAPHAAVYGRTSQKRFTAYLLTVTTVLTFFGLVGYVCPDYSPLMDNMFGPEH